MIKLPPQYFLVWMAFIAAFATGAFPWLPASGAGMAIGLGVSTLITLSISWMFFYTPLAAAIYAARTAGQLTRSGYIVGEEVPYAEALHRFHRMCRFNRLSPHQCATALDSIIMPFREGGANVDDSDTQSAIAIAIDATIKGQRERQKAGLRLGAP